MANNIKVAVRVRPLSNREKEKGGISIVDVNNDVIDLTNLKVDVNNPYGDSRERIKQFTFDYCYNSNCNVEYPDNGSQEQIFQDLGTDVIQSAVEGYNACLFAYGQTSTGKTYTMTGTEDEVGLIPRICEGLFSHVETCEDEQTTFKIEISYLEIYNERVRDLLKPGFANEKYVLKVREHPKDGPYVQDLSSHTVKNCSEIFNLLDTGNENRTTAATHMHEHSSRSHAIVTLVFTQALLEDDLPREIISKVHLVDLAGSERADTTSTLNYKSRLKEGANINKSLVTLGNVIKSLAERSLLSWTQMGSTQSFSSFNGESPSSPRRPQTLFIPYRDSVLTWLLRDSLGGNSKTIMISTITPASQYYNETLSTLRYAQRAKNIVNKPTINEDTNVALIRTLQEEIKRLRHELANAQLHGSTGDLFYLPEGHFISHSSSESDLQAGQHVTMRDQGTVVERLQEKENMAKKLTQSWKDKWSNPFQEGGFGFHELRRASSHGIILDSQILVPHLVGLDDDILSSGVVIYRLDAGRLYIGTEDAESPQDIELSGNGIEKEHCFIENDNGDVIIYPNPGCLCKINSIEISQPSPLRQGDELILGTNTTFRFNNPAEAARLREHRNKKTKSKRSLRDDNASTPTKDFLTVPVPMINRQSTQPFTMFNPRLESAEFCVELNNKYPREVDRIEQASQELDKLRGELREREEKIQTQEEELTCKHQKTKHELEEEKKKLAEAVKEYQRKKSKVEELEKENSKLLAEDQKYLRKLEKEADQIQKSKDKGTSEITDIIPEDSSAIRQRKRSVEGRLKDIAQQELVHKVSSIEKARSLALQEELLEEEEESIQVHQQRVRSQEQTIKVLDKSLHEEIKLRKKEVGKLEAQEDQIKAYIQENKDLIKVAMDKPNPIRSGVSELNLHSKSRPTGDKKSISPLSHAKLSRVRHSSPIKDVSSSEVSLESPKGSSESIRRKQKSPSPPKSITSSAENVTSRLYRQYEVKHRDFLRRSSGHKLQNQPVRSTPKNRVPLTTPAPQIIHRSPKPIINAPLKIKKFGGSDSSLARPGLVRSKSLMRQIASMSNLASVPEASLEAESEAESMHSEPNIPIAVAKVRRRNKRTFRDDERSHSMPMDGNFEHAWDQYAKEQGLKNHAHYSDSSESDIMTSKNKKRYSSYQDVGIGGNDHEGYLSESTQTDLDLDMDTSDSDTNNKLSIGVGVNENELSATLDDSVSIPDSLDGEEQSVEKTPRNDAEFSFEDSFRSDTNPKYEGLWTEDMEVPNGVENYVLLRNNANKLEDSMESVDTVIRQNISDHKMHKSLSQDSDENMSEDSLCDSEEHMDSLESPNSVEPQGDENYMLVSETNYPYSEITSNVRGRVTPEYTVLNLDYSKDKSVPYDITDCAKRQKLSDTDPNDANSSKSMSANPKKQCLPLQYNDSHSESDSPSSSVDSSSPSLSQQQPNIVSPTSPNHQEPHTILPHSPTSYQSGTDSLLPTTPIRVRYKVSPRKNKLPSSPSNDAPGDSFDRSASSLIDTGLLAMDSQSLPANSQTRHDTKADTKPDSVDSSASYPTGTDLQAMNSQSLPANSQSRHMERLKDSAKHDGINAYCLSSSLSHPDPVDSVDSSASSLTGTGLQAMDSQLRPVNSQSKHMERLKDSAKPDGTKADCLPSSWSNPDLGDSVDSSASSTTGTGIDLPATDSQSRSANSQRSHMERLKGSAKPDGTKADCLPSSLSNPDLGDSVNSSASSPTGTGLHIMDSQLPSDSRSRHTESPFYRDGIKTETELQYEVLDLSTETSTPSDNENISNIFNQRQNSLLHNLSTQDADDSNEMQTQVLDISSEKSVSESEHDSTVLLSDHGNKDHIFDHPVSSRPVTSNPADNNQVGSVSVSRNGAIKDCPEVVFVVKLKPNNNSSSDMVVLKSGIEDSVKSTDNNQSIGSMAVSDVNQVDDMSDEHMNMVPFLTPGTVYTPFLDEDGEVNHQQIRQEFSNIDDGSTSAADMSFPDSLTKDGVTFIETGFQKSNNKSYVKLDVKTKRIVKTSADEIEEEAHSDVSRGKDKSNSGTEYSDDSLANDDNDVAMRSTASTICDGLNQGPESLDSLNNTSRIATSGNHALSSSSRMDHPGQQPLPSFSGTLAPGEVIGKQDDISSQMSQDSIGETPQLNIGVKEPRNHSANSHSSTTNRRQRRRSQRPHKDFRSDDTDEFSDDSLASGPNSKPPSRPNSGKSGKRKRKPRNSEEHRKGDITSDEYAHSANSSFSDDSLIFSIDGRGMQEPSEGTKLEIATINESINQMNTALNRLPNTSENYKVADGTMTMSPVNVWSSGDSGIQPYTDVSTCGVQTNTSDNVSIVSPKRQSWTLSISQPEIWMNTPSENSDLLAGSQASAETNMAELRSSSPTKVERLHQSSIEQDTDGKIKYLVTINEDETKILYNVEKTEYRTFSVGDEVNPTTPSVIPNTININLTETKTIQKKDNYEAREREKILYHRGNEDLDSADAIVSSHFYQEGRSLQTEQDVIGDIVSRESSVDRQLVDSDDRSFIKPSSRVKVQQESVLKPIDVEHVLNDTLTEDDDPNSPESFVSSSVDFLHEADYVTEEMDIEANPQTESGRSVTSTGCSTAGIQEFSSNSTDVDQLYSGSLDSLSSSQNTVNETLYFQDEITLSEQQLNGVKQKDDVPKKSPLQINQRDIVVHGSSVDDEPILASPSQKSPVNRLSQIAISPEPTRMNLISPRSPEEEFDDGYASINVNDGKLISLSYHPDIGQFQIPLDSKSSKSNSRKTSLEGPLSMSSRKSSLKNTDGSRSTTMSDEYPQTKQKSENDNLCDDLASTMLPSNTNPKDSPTEDQIDSFSQSDNEHIINYSLYPSAAMVPQDALMSTTFNKQLAFDLSKKNTPSSAESPNHLQDQSLISSKVFAIGDVSKKNVSPSAETYHHLQEQLSLSSNFTVSSVYQNKDKDMENESYLHLQDQSNQHKEGGIENASYHHLQSSESSTMGAHQQKELFKKKVSASAERNDSLQDQSHQHKEEERGSENYHPESSISARSYTVYDAFQNKEEEMDNTCNSYHHPQSSVSLESSTMGADQHKELFKKNVSVFAERYDSLEDQSHQDNEEMENYHHPQSSISTRSYTVCDAFQHEDLLNRDTSDVHTESHHHLQNQHKERGMENESSYQLQSSVPLLALESSTSGAHQCIDLLKKNVSASEERNNSLLDPSHQHKEEERGSENYHPESSIYDAFQNKEEEMDNNSHHHPQSTVSLESSTMGAHQHKELFKKNVSASAERYDSLEDQSHQHKEEMNNKNCHQPQFSFSARSYTVDDAFLHEDLLNSDISDVHTESHHHLQDQFGMSLDSLTMDEALHHKEKEMKTESRISALDEVECSHMHGYGKRVKSVMISERGDLEELKAETRRPSLVFDSRTDILSEHRPTFDVYKKDDTSITVMAKPASLRIFLPESSLLKSSSDFVESIRQHGNDLMISKEDLDEGLSPQQSLRIGGAFLNSDMTDSVGSNQSPKTICNKTMASLEPLQNSSSIVYLDKDSPQAALKIGQAFLGSSPVQSSVNRLSSQSNTLHTRSDVNSTQKIIQFIHPMSKNSENTSISHIHQIALTGGLNELHQRTLLGGTNTSFHLTESDQSEIEDSGFHTHTTTDSSLSPDSEEQKSPRRHNSIKSNSSSVSTHSVTIGIELKSDYQIDTSDEHSTMSDNLSMENEELRFDVQHIEFDNMQSNFYDEIDSVIDETVVVQSEILNSNNLRSVGIRTDNSMLRNFQQISDSSSEQTLISVDSSKIDTASNQSKSSEFNSSGDIYLTPENNSTSNSSIYKTPEQSPRLQQTSHIGPTYSDGLPVSSTRFNKTHQFENSSETVDSLKWELARRIAKLQSRCKSLSDSAISSDFTDVERSGSFRQISNRMSRRSSGCGSGYISRKELDRSLQEISVYLDNVPPQNLIDHTIQRSMEYTDIPNQLAQAMLESRSLMGSPAADNLANILDNRRPARLYGRKWRSLGDLSELSGSEILRMLKADFDESLSRQSSSDDYYLPPNKVSNATNDKSQRYISWGDIQCRSLDETNIEQELVVSAASRTDQFNILLDECNLSPTDSPNSPLSPDQLDFYLGNIHSSQEDQPKRNSVDQGVNCDEELFESMRRIRHKSPSMSDLEHGEPVVKDFEKAHSTGCVDILDSPVPSISSSNDSITFVFVGNSEEKSDVTHSNPNVNKSSSSSSPQTSSRRGQSEGHLAIISHQFENNHLTRRQLSGMNDSRSEKSVSCDNLSTQGNKELRRSYSTSLLDVVQIEEPEIEPFPPSGSADDLIDGEDERGEDEEFLPVMFSKQNVSSGLRRTVTGQYGNSCLSNSQLQDVKSISKGEAKNRFHKQELHYESQMDTKTVYNDNYHSRGILVNRLTQTDDHNQLYNHHLDWQEYRHDHLDITSADLSDESGFITDAYVYSPPTSFRDVSSNLHSTSTIQNFSGCTNSDLITVNQTVMKQTIESEESSTSSSMTKVSSSTQTTDSEREKDILNKSNTETQTSPAISPIASPVIERRATLVQTDREYKSQSFTDGPTNTTILEEIADLRKEHTKMMALLERSKRRPSRPSQLDLLIKQKSITSDSSGSVSPVTVIDKLAFKQESSRSRRTDDIFDSLYSTTTTTMNNRDSNDDVDDLRLKIDLESFDSSFTNQSSTSSQPSSSRSKRDHNDSLVYVPIGDDNKRYFVTTAASPDQPTSQESHKKSESIQDQLDKLQLERIEIIDLLNLNYLPASLTVELLEAKLNHCIGQTDALLQSVDETWDDDLLARPQPPVQNITEITKEYINKYRTELKKSKRYYDVIKEEMERKVSKGRGRRRSRTTDLIELKRKSQIEAFKRERQLEQERYEKTKLSTSRQTSPASPATSSSSFEPGYLTPRQRIDHLVGLRRNIVESSEEELNELRRRSVSPRFSDRSFSPDYYSLYSPSPSPRSMSLGNNPYGNIVDPFPSLYSPDVSFSGRTSVSPIPGFKTGSTSRLTSTARTPTSSNTQSTDHLAYISLPYQDYMANQLDPSKLLQESAAVRSRNLQEISRAHLFLHQSRHLADVPFRTSSPVVKHPAEVREYSPQSPNHGITKMDIDKDIEQLRTIQKSTNYVDPSFVRCASPIGSDVSSASSYAAYAKDILARSERSVHSPRSKLNSTFSGTTRTFSPRPSTPSSIYSADLESLTDSTSSSLLNTRPVNARDIKARIARRKLTERRNKKPSDKR